MLEASKENLERIMEFELAATKYASSPVPTWSGLTEVSCRDPLDDAGC